MRRPIVRSLFVFLALGSLVAGACKSDGKVVLTDGNAAAAAAAKRSAEPGSVRFALRYDGQQGEGPAINVVGEGAFDFDAQVGSMNVTLGDTATEVVVTRDTLYGKLPSLLGKLGKPWVSYNLAKGGGLIGGLDQVAKLADPREALSRLELVSDMQRVGSEKVRGVETVHFRGKVDLSDASLAKLPDAVRVKAREYRQNIGTESHPIDLWLDKDGRIRRIDSEVSGTSDNQPVTVKTHIELFSYGDKVSVSVPPPDQVQDSSTFGG